MFGHDGGMAFGGLFMWIFWLILLMLVVAIIRAIFSGASSVPGSQRPAD